MYSYPFYRSPYFYNPGLYPGVYGGWGNSYFNAFQSQIGNQSLINTGTASDINQNLNQFGIW
jgi:hypothetical protein